MSTDGKSASWRSGKGVSEDAVVVYAPIDNIDAVVAEIQRIMAQASRLVLHGFELRSEAKIVRYPDRYMDKRGKSMWATVWEIVEELERST